MKYSLRFVWYILRIVIISASAFALLVVAFFIAMDSANVYVIVTDGMKAQATNVLMPDQAVDLTKYFSEDYTSKHTNVDSSKYANFMITDINYKLNVESLWCNPWQNTATVTVVESIPDMTYTSSGDQPDSKAVATPPAWQRARYKITCLKRNDEWRIESVTKIEDLQPEPTASPEPSTYITASPLPTTPAPSASPSPTPVVSPSPTPTKK